MKLYLQLAKNMREREREREREKSAHPLPQTSMSAFSTTITY